MDAIRRLAEIITIVVGIMTWWLVDQQPIKWLAAGVTLTAVVFSVLHKPRRRDNPGVELSDVNRTDRVAHTEKQRPLTHEEIMAEDARELLRMNREHKQQVHEFYLENARRKQGLDKE